MDDLTERFDKMVEIRNETRGERCMCRDNTFMGIVPKTLPSSLDARIPTRARVALEYLKCRVVKEEERCLPGKSVKSRMNGGNNCSNDMSFLLRMKHNVIYFAKMQADRSQESGLPSALRCPFAG